MKLRKLNAQGVAHHFLLAVIVVGIAVGGTYYLIASHADTCDGTSDPTSSVSDQTDPGAASGASDPTSGVDCEPDSSPVTAPSPAPGGNTLSCIINNVPATPTSGAGLNPSVTITNNGSETATPDFTSTLLVEGKTVNTTSYVSPSIDANGGSVQVSLLQYSVPFSTSSTSTAASYTVTGDAGFNCQAAFSLPVKPTYGISCTITGVPSTIKPGQSFTPGVTFKNTGTGNTSLGVYGEIDNTNNYPGSNVVAFPDTSKNIGANQSITIPYAAYKPVNKLSGSGKVTVQANYYPSSTQLTASCSANFKVVVPTVKSYTITPDMWYKAYGPKLTKDGSHGNVIAFPKNTDNGGFVSNESYAKNSIARLKGFDDFLFADSAKDIQVCATMRTDKAKTSMTIYLGDIVKGYPLSGGKVVGKDTVTNKYRTYCHSFTAKTFTIQDTGQPLIQFGPSQGPAQAATVYLDNTTYSLK